MGISLAKALIVYSTTFCKDTVKFDIVKVQNNKFVARINTIAFGEPQDTIDLAKTFGLTFLQSLLTDGITEITNAM